jgi:hypothetical protein
MRVEVVERRPSPHGTVFDICSNCEVRIPRNFDVDLDEAQPGVTASFNKVIGKRTNDFPYQVTDKDAEVIDLMAYTGSCDCRWNLYLDWTAQGRSGSVLLNEKGKPFRTTSYIWDRRYCDDGPLFRPCKH